MTIAQIHRALGDKVNQRWTMDALDFLSDRIDADGKIPTSYSLSSRQPMKPLDWDNGTLFPKDKYARARGRGVLDSGVR